MGAAAAVVIVGLVGVCVGLWLLRSALEPEPPRAAVATPVAFAVSQPAAPRCQVRPNRADLRGNDTVDPCTSPVDPEVPPDDTTW